jgi:hypothetical protein
MSKIPVITMSAEEAQERIEELQENGWYVEEVVSYRVVSPDHKAYGTGEDEDEAWDDTLYQMALDDYYATQRQLEKWNASVAGKGGAK